MVQKPMLLRGCLYELSKTKTQMFIGLDDAHLSGQAEDLLHQLLSL